MLQEARSLPFVGERLAGKIEEIISSGGLRRLDAEDKEKQAVLSAFTKIHGVGQTTAQQFYAQVSMPGPQFSLSLWWCCGKGDAVTVEVSARSALVVVRGGRRVQLEVTACSALR